MFLEKSCALSEQAVQIPLVLNWEGEDNETPKLTTRSPPKRVFFRCPITLLQEVTLVIKQNPSKNQASAE